jgi:uncharacterized protein (TIGR03435 family)
MKRRLWLGILLASAAAAQPGPPRFDVVSIRPVPPNAPMRIVDPNSSAFLPGGKFVDRASVRYLIAIAYNIDYADRRVEGMPKWANEEPFDVSAQPAPGFPALPPNENQEQVRLMVQTLLAERFHLRLHTETRRGPVYYLEVAKGGVKLKEAAPPIPPEKQGHVFASWSDSDIRMIGTKAMMSDMAIALTGILSNDVVDQTGLTAYYDVNADFRGPRAPGPENPGFGAEGTALLFSNLQSQFGLRLTKVSGDLKYWVVDNVERPGDN